ncbi:MAG: VOC family protein [Bacteroidales bacterium]|jgi:predicted enzyme related to lactoylglutathione lyase|nr:VOC family protein [Bacteroidales bacterium]
MEKSKNNMVGWFEIPVSDMERAIRFYETVFQIDLCRQQMGPLDMAMFPWNETGFGTTGALVFHMDYYKPQSNGVLIYFTSRAGDVNDELSRIEITGGSIVQVKTRISDDIGYMAVIIDCEGNRIALHSRA